MTSTLKSLFRSCCTRAVVIAVAFGSGPAAIHAGKPVALDAPQPFIHSAHAFDGAYPRLFVTPDQRDDLRRQVAEVDFKKKAFNALVASLQPYVQRHASDPQWILSRIPMNRQPGKRFVAYVMRKHQGAVPPHIEGIGDATVPTLRFEGNAIFGFHADRVDAAPLEDVTPNGVDTFNVLITDPATKKKNLKQVDLNLASLTFQTTVEQIEKMARNSAYLYWLTGDERYARFASDILRTLADAAAVMKPITSEPGAPELARSERYLAGNVFTNEALGTTLAQGMDYLHDYFVHQGIDLRNYEFALKNIALMSPPSTTPHNIPVGDNLMNLQLALAMSGDKTWSQQYLNGTLEGVTAQASHLDKNGVWIEPCAYSDYTVDWFMQILWIGYNNHLDVLNRYPQIFKSGTSQLRDLYPNAVYTGDGDNWSANPRVWVVEPALSIAERTGNTQLEKQLSEYVSLMIENGIYRSRGDGADPVDAINVFIPRLKYASTGCLQLAPSTRNDTRQSLALRNIPPLAPPDASRNSIRKRDSDQSAFGLQATMYGTMEGTAHRHEQGITLELYGCGNVLGLDPGPGEDAYSGPVHNGFNVKWAAHNTVVVDGASTGCPDMKARMLEPEDGAAPASTSFSFMKGASVDPNSRKEQERLVLVVRTSPVSGYYVDIYHSAGKGKNEYLYHNVAQSFDVLGKGGSLTPQPAPGELMDDQKRNQRAFVGYRFLDDKRSFPIGQDDVQVRFNTPYKDQPEPAHLSMFMLGGPGRALISANTPAKAAHRAYNGYVDKPIPMVVFRQEGEAWSRPFVAVFEPYRGDHQTVRAVKRLMPTSNEPSFTGLSVESSTAPGQIGAITDHFFTSTNPSAHVDGASWTFKGLCGVVRTIGGTPSELYLGSGCELGCDKYRLSCETEHSADLLLRGSQPPVLNSTGEITVTLPLPAQQPRKTPPNIRLLEGNHELTATNVQMQSSPDSGADLISATFPATHGGVITIRY